MVCLPLFLLSSRHTMTYYKRYKETVQSKLVSNKILNKCYFSCNTSITFLKGMGYDEFWVPIMLSCPQLFERLTLLKRTAPRTELRKGSLITTYPQSFPSPAISCVFPWKLYVSLWERATWIANYWKEDGGGLHVFLHFLIWNLEIWGLRKVMLILKLPL